MQPTRLLLAIVLVGSACAAPAKDAPSSQAAIAAPVKAIPDDPIERRVAVDQGYSLLGATMLNHDLPMLASLYARDALLAFPDTTVRGAPAVAARLAQLAQSKSVVAFNRTSLGLRIVDDSTIADSGSFVMISRRSPTDSVMNPGMYHTLWRARPGLGNWVILEDRILPGAGRRKNLK